MSSRTFAHRSETFGYDTPRPWASDALRLLFNVPRLYSPLAQAWDELHPGSLAALKRMTRMGFVEHQGPVVLDTRTGEPATHRSRAVDRYRTTAKGRSLLAESEEDLRVVEDLYPRTGAGNVDGVLNLLEVLDLNGSHAKYGLSMAHAVELSGLRPRTGRWWMSRLVDAGMIRRLPDRWPDVRQVVPEHWRPTRMLCRQLDDVVKAFDEAPASLPVEFRLGRTRFLDDIDPARLGISGATDFDHDVEMQRVLASLLGSPSAAADGAVLIEPRYFLPHTRTTNPWEFRVDGANDLHYQPDAEIRERTDRGIRRCVIEYERYQTRRDAWCHIERFLGYLHTKAMPFESAALRFVVDSPSRVRSYVQLIEAFTDWAEENRNRMPANEMTLAVASVQSLDHSNDPLDDTVWYRICLPAPNGADPRPVTHPRDRSPYGDYFTRHRDAP